VRSGGSNRLFWNCRYMPGTSGLWIIVVNNKGRESIMPKPEPA
jgi:hypothetical protein